MCAGYAGSVEAAAFRLRTPKGWVGKGFTKLYMTIMGIMGIYKLYMGIMGNYGNL